MTNNFIITIASLVVGLALLWTAGQFDIVSESICFLAGVAIRHYFSKISW